MQTQDWQFCDCKKVYQHLWFRKANEQIKLCDTFSLVERKTMPATTETFNLASTTVSNPSKKIWNSGCKKKHVPFDIFVLYGVLVCWWQDIRLPSLFPVYTWPWWQQQLYCIWLLLIPSFRSSSPWCPWASNRSVVEWSCSVPACGAFQCGWH